MRYAVNHTTFVEAHDEEEAGAILEAAMENLASSGGPVGESEIVDVTETPE